MGGNESKPSHAAQEYETASMKEKDKQIAKLKEELVQNNLDAEAQQGQASVQQRLHESQRRFAARRRLHVNGQDTQGVQAAVDDANNSVRRLSEEVLQSKKEVDQLLAADFKLMTQARARMKTAVNLIDQLGDYVTVLEEENQKLGEYAKKNQKEYIRDSIKTMRTYLQMMQTTSNAVKDEMEEIKALLEKKMVEEQKVEEKLKALREKVEREKADAEAQAKKVREEVKQTGWTFLGNLCKAALYTALTVAIAVIIAFCIFVPGGVLYVALFATIEISAIVAIDKAAPKVIAAWQSLKGAMIKKEASDERVKKTDQILKTVMQTGELQTANQESLRRMRSEVRRATTNIVDFQTALEDFESNLDTLEKTLDLPGVSSNTLFQKKYEKMQDALKLMKTTQSDAAGGMRSLVSSCDEWERDLRFQEQQLDQLHVIALEGHGQSKQVDWNYYNTLDKAIEETPSPRNLESALAPMESLILKEMRKRSVESGTAEPPNRVDFAKFSAECEHSFHKCYTAEHIPVYSASSAVFHATNRFQNGVLSSEAKLCLPFYKGLHCDSTTGLKVLPLESKEHYRGVPYKFPAAVMGAKICYSEPKSASTSREVAEDFASNMGTIITFKSTKARRITASFFPDEDEVVIPMLSFFHVEKLVSSAEGVDELVLVELNDAQKQSLIKGAM